MRSVLQDWVMTLPLRAQGTLLTGIRGCDLTPKPSVFTIQPERELVAFLRYCCLVPADKREVDIAGAFFQSHPPDRWKPSQFGHYPEHWYAHLMHCFEVVAMDHPNGDLAEQAQDIYEQLVHNLHLNPETRDQYDARMNEDRIAAGTVVS